MPDISLVDYIRKETKKGFAKDIIKEALKVRGYLKADIDSAFAAFSRLEEKIEETPAEIASGLQEMPSFFERQVEKIPAEAQKVAEVIRFDRHVIKHKREWIFIAISVLLVLLGYFFVAQNPDGLRLVLMKIFLLIVFIALNFAFIALTFLISRTDSSKNQLWDMGLILGLFLLLFSFIPYMRWLSFVIYNVLFVALLKKHYKLEDKEMLKIWGIWILLWLVLAAIIAL
jgi:hypothetical protein